MQDANDLSEVESLEREMANMMVVRKKKNISGLISRNNQNLISPIDENKEVDVVGQREIEIS